MALDASGDTLRQALAKIDLAPRGGGNGSEENIRLKTPQPGQGRGWKQYNLNGSVNGGFSPRSISDSPGNRSPGTRESALEEGVSADEEYFSPRTSMAEQ